MVTKQKMTYSTQMNKIVEERYQFCIWLTLIAKKRGVENIINVDLFRDFLKTPQYTEVATLEGHTGIVFCLTHLKNKLFSGSIDNSIRVWNTETHETIATLEGGEEMSNIIINDNKMYVAINEKRAFDLLDDEGEVNLTVSLDDDDDDDDDDGPNFVPNTIRIWNTETYETIATLRGHEYGRVCLTLHENKLYSGGSDNTIRVWNTETYEEIANWEGHNRWVKCLTIHENKLYSGGDDKTIRIWNTETYEKITTLRGHKKSVICLTHDGNKLYSGSTDKTIRVWNTETYECIATLRGHTSVVSCLTIHENKLFSGSWDSTIRIWNTETYEHIRTLRWHAGFVNSLAIHENKLYSGSYDGTISVWKI